MHELIKNFIDGEWVGAGKTIKNINPATGESIGDVVASGKAETESAIAAAKRAFPAWRRVPAPRRGDILVRAAVEMARRKDELARALTLEEGKTLGEASG
ncbi:MAG TPA: aldehyde dehydrogenase family protein, partial [Polyangia bacterium]